MGNPFSLEGKQAVVFGGAGYIGSRLVRDMLELGAKVLVGDVSEKAFAGEAFAENRAHPNCAVQVCDMRSTAEIRGAFDQCRARFGGCNAAVNLATFGRLNTLEASTDEEIADSLEGVAGQAFRVVREAIPYLEQNGGVIVNTSSMYGIVSPDYRIYGDSGQDNPPAYGMGKAAVLSLTRYAAAHLARKGIRVNCVAPGPVPDPSKQPPADFLRAMAEKTMLGRVGKPEEISGAFLYLLSDAASFTTGECIVVDGGWTKW